MTLQNWPGICPCGREGKGFFFAPQDGLRTPSVPACSMHHLNLIKFKKGKVADMALTNNENMAIMAASPEIGEFLEEMGVTDMAKMTEEQWLDFLAHTFERICEHNAANWAGGDVPY